jgi:hypothetical protein
MTMFWPAPTQAPSPSPWPPGWRFGDQMEEEYYDRPPNVDPLTSLGINREGYGEIKAHNYKGLLQGHNQLKALDDDKTFRARKPEPLRVLITYRPTTWVARATRPDMFPKLVDIFAVKYHKNWGPSDYQSRGRWAFVAREPVPPTVPVNLLNRSVFGGAMEEPIRRKFLARIGRRDLTGHKSAADVGLDVRWAEIAELYARLGDELQDEFLSELGAALVGEPSSPLAPSR